MKRSLVRFLGSAPESILLLLFISIGNSLVGDMVLGVVVRHSIIITLHYYSVIGIWPAARGHLDSIMSEFIHIFFFLFFILSEFLIVI